MTDRGLLHVAAVVARGPVTDPPPEALGLLGAARRAGLVREDRSGRWVLAAKGARALRGDAPDKAGPDGPRPDRAMEVLANARDRTADG